MPRIQPLEVDQVAPELADLIAQAQRQEHFDQQQIIEITVRTGLANFFNHLIDALQIEIEPRVEPLLTSSITAAAH